MTLYDTFKALGLTDRQAEVAASGREAVPGATTDFTGRMTKAFRGLGLSEATATKAAEGRTGPGPVRIDGLGDAWESAVKAAMSIHGFNDRRARTYLRTKASAGEWKDLTDPEEILAALRKYASLAQATDTASGSGSEVTVGAGNAHPPRGVAESRRYRRELIESW